MRHILGPLVLAASLAAGQEPDRDASAIFPDAGSTDATADAGLPRGTDVTQLSLDELLDTPIAVVTRSARKSSETPGVVSVMSREEIAASGARDLLELCGFARGVPQVFVCMASRPVRAAVLALCVAAAPALAVEVPDELALKLMLRVVTYDGNFGHRGSGSFVVLVPFAPGQQARAEQLVELAARLGLNTIANRPLKFTAIALAELDVNKASALLVPRGTAGQAGRDAVLAATREKLYTMAFDEALVKDGAMIGVGSSDGRPQVLLNIVTCRAIGADVSSAVLKVSRTFQ